MQRWEYLVLVARKETICPRTGNRSDQPGEHGGSNNINIVLKRPKL